MISFAAVAPLRDCIAQFARFAVKVNRKIAYRFNNLFDYCGLLLCHVVLAYEAMDAQFFAPAKGFTEISPLVMRPGETAKAEVIVYGPMPACTVTIGSASTALDAVEKGKHRKFVLAGCHSGVQPISIVPREQDDEIAARFEFIKRYSQELQSGAR